MGQEVDRIKCKGGSGISRVTHHVPAEPQGETRAAGVEQCSLELRLSNLFCKNFQSLEILKIIGIDNIDNF